MKRDSSNKIHPTAIIHPNVKMGKNNEIGAYVIINDLVSIGDNNIISPFCLIGEVAEDNKFHWKPAKGVVIGNNNRLTGKITVDCGTVRNTEIRNNVLILKNAHIGHDAILDDNSSVRVNSIIGGHCHIGKNALVGLTCIIPPRVDVPEGAMIGSMSNVTKKSNLKENWVHYGSPCKAVRPRD